MTAVRTHIKDSRGRQFLDSSKISRCYTVQKYCGGYVITSLEEEDVLHLLSTFLNEVLEQTHNPNAIAINSLRRHDLRETDESSECFDQTPWSKLVWSKSLCPRVVFVGLQPLRFAKSRAAESSVHKTTRSVCTSHTYCSVRQEWRQIFFMIYYFRFTDAHDAVLDYSDFFFNHSS